MKPLSPLISRNFSVYVNGKRHDGVMCFGLELDPNSLASATVKFDLLEGSRIDLEKGEIHLRVATEDDFS